MRLAEDDAAIGFDNKQQDIRPSETVEGGRTGRSLPGEVLQSGDKGLLLFDLPVDGANLLSQANQRRRLGRLPSPDQERAEDEA